MAVPDPPGADGLPALEPARAVEGRVDGVRGRAGGEHPDDERLVVGAQRQGVLAVGALPQPIEVAVLGEEVPLDGVAEAVDGLADRPLVLRAAVEVSLDAEQPHQHEGALHQVPRADLLAEAARPPLRVHPVRPDAMEAVGPLQEARHLADARGGLRAGDPAALGAEQVDHHAEAAAADGQRGERRGIRHHPGPQQGGVVVGIAPEVVEARPLDALQDGAETLRREGVVGRLRSGAAERFSEDAVHGLSLPQAARVFGRVLQ